MNAASRKNQKLVKINFPIMSIGGAMAALLGIVSLAAGRVGAVVGVALILSGLGAIAFSLVFQLLSRLAELLTEIASHLAAIRAQMEKGVFGLLG